MTTLFVLMPFVALFMAINVIIGCYMAIRLGYGPPNWQTALNQVVRLTTFQSYLNEWRDWLEKKIPWTERFFNRLHIPKPIIFIDVSVMEEEIEEVEEGEPEEEKIERNEEDDTDFSTNEANEETANEIERLLGQQSGGKIPGTDETTATASEAAPL